MGSDLIVERRTPLAASPGETFAWHARPGALERLTPPWIRLEVLERGAVRTASRVRFRIRQGPILLNWIAEYAEVEPGRGFSDFQVQGPFDRWMHSHRFEDGPNGGTILHDRIQCELPLGSRVGRWYVRRELERALAYRHAVTAADLAMHAAVPGRPLHIAVTGASGFLGSLLIPVLTTGGHRVTRLVRRAPRVGEIQWGSGAEWLNGGALRGIDAVVHLAGATIARRWTASRKREILESRRTGTGMLAEAIARAPEGPPTLVSASAIGYYGDRGEELLDEASAPGSGFLPDVVGAWEAATAPAEAAGARVVRLRIGLPLSPAGGLLGRMLPPFRLGVGGRLGRGTQWMSWISADDLLGAWHLALTRDTVSGALNAVAPHPVRNAEFAAALGRALRRPARLPVPAAALRLLFGSMADEAILASTKVAPDGLRRLGYRFRHETLAAALSHELGTPLGNLR